MIIPVLNKTIFNYSYLSSSATEDVIVADEVPIANAKTVALSVRIHNLQLTAGAKFRFDVLAVYPSETDGTVFITSGGLSTADIVSATPNLIGLSAIITDPIFPFLRVVLHAQGPSGTGTTYGEFSADMVLREAG